MKTISKTLLDASPALCTLVDTGEGIHPATYADAARAYDLACGRLTVMGEQRAQERARMEERNAWRPMIA